MKKSFGATTIPMPAPVWVVGTYDADGKPNVMTASWVGICCSRPPCVAVSLRKATYSYANIVSRQAYTVSVPSKKYARIADYWGIASGRDVDKFSRAGLTPLRSKLVDAPYVDEFPVVMECKVIHTLEIGLHTQFIGEILDIKIDESMLDPGGNPDGEKLDIFVLMDGYRSVEAYVGKAFSIGKDV
jgi:flavin reductase (DIM6/NTAB) family NADH-FMN oxidoreductase RutF